MSYLIDDINIVREVFDKSTVQIDTVSLLLDIKIIVCEVEIIHPVIFASASFKELENPAIIISLSD